MYKVFKIIEENDEDPEYMIFGKAVDAYESDNMLDYMYEIISVYYDKKSKEIYLEHEISCGPTSYELESVYDRVTDAMVHIKYELNLRNQLDKQEESK